MRTWKFLAVVAYLLAGASAAQAATASRFQNVVISGTQTNSALGTGLVHSSAAGLFSSSLLVDADVSASAAIAYSKLAALTNNRALTSNGSGVVSVSSTSKTQLEYLGSATGTTGTTSTNIVFSTSPTLVTPNLGTPSAVVLTNATGTASGLTAGTVTTNANLTGPITSVGNATSVASQTGTGSTFVMNTSPTLVTPNLGTPSAVVLTNATGTASGLTAGAVTTNANLTGDVTSVGNATTLATVNGNVGSFGSSTSIPTFTVNAKGLITAASGNAVVAPAGTLSGATLAAGVTASSLTSTGTLTSSVWNATAIGAAYGGTGGSSAAATGLAKVAAGVWSYATLVNADVSSSAAIARSKIADGTNYRVLCNTSAGVFSECAAITASRALVSDANGQPTHATTTTTQLNYLGSATGTTGTTSSNVVFSASPTFTGTVTTAAQSVGGNITFSNTSTQGIVGTTTNDDAASGNVGQWVSVNSPTGGTATPGSSTSYVDITSVPLSAGDWMCSGNVTAQIGATGAVSRIAASLTTASVTPQTTAGGWLDETRPAGGFVVSNDYSWALSPRRVTLSAPGTIYMTGTLTYSALGGSTWGSRSRINCLRVR